MKKIKKLYARNLSLLVLIMALLISLTSCQNNKTVKTAKYTATEFAVSGNSESEALQNIYNLRYINDKIYYYHSSFDGDEETYSSKLKSMDLDGNNDTVVLEFDEELSNNSIQDYSVDSSNNIWALFAEYAETEQTEDNGMISSEINNYIKVYDSNQNEITSIDLSTIIPNSTDNYILSFDVTPNGNICISQGSKTYILDSTGNLQNTIDFSYIFDVSLLGESKLIISGYDADKFAMKVYDFTKNDLDKECKLESAPDFIATNNVDTVYIGSSTGVSIYDIEKEKSTLLFKWSDMNINPSNLSETVALSDDRFLVSEYGEDMSNGNALRLLQRDDNAPDDERQVITLGCMYLDYVLQKNIVDFNKTNTKYKVEFKEYDTGISDANDVYTQLNTEIISGKSLDLIDIAYIPDRSNYEQKNLLVDLNTYLDNDQDISKSDFIENVIAAYETNGKLYSITPAFMINTLVGTADKLGTTGAMTFAQVNECLANNNITEIYNDIQSEVLKHSLCTSQSAFVNLEQKTCSFDSPEFKSVLEYVSKFPSEYSEDYSVSDYKKFLDGNVLFLNANISSGQDYILYKSLAKDQLTFTGYPSLDENGNIIYASTELGILDKSANKDGAWEFIKYVLSEEAQDSLEWNFPLRKTSLDKMLLEATKSQDNTESASSDESESYEETYSYGSVITDDGIEIEMTNITVEEIDIIKNIIAGSKHIAHYDDKILEIIEDEAGAYFTGSKSIDDVASAIQSRAQVYISEQK